MPVLLNMEESVIKSGVDGRNVEFIRKINVFILPKWRTHGHWLLTVF